MSLVTVIVPTYKKFEFLQETLESIYAQDYPSIEILIADDGSDNFDLTFVEGLLSKAPKHFLSRVIHLEQNIGTVKNLNNAIKEAKGELVSLLAADDLFFDSSTLSTLVKKLGKNNVITGKAIGMTKEGQLTAIYPQPSTFFFSFPSWMLYLHLCFFLSLYAAPAAVYKKKFLFEQGLFDEKFIYLEDLPFWMKLTRNNIRVQYLPKIVAKHRDGGISSSSGISPTLQREIYQTLVREYETCPDTLWGKWIKGLLIVVIQRSFPQYDVACIGQTPLRGRLFFKIARKTLALVLKILRGYR
ncbi:MAG: glycosyltransferase family 2 protein [Brevinema sp.]